MAGIFGFYLKSESLHSLNIVNALIRNAKHHFEYSSNYLIMDNKKVCLGFAHPFLNSSWPVKSRDGNFVFQLFGEIFLPDGSLLSDKNFESAFLLPFIEMKEHFLNSLEGNFIFVLFDEREKSFILANDPFGNFALHYVYNKDLFIFSTQIHGITDVLPEKQWDQQGLDEYLGLGFTLNGRTYYRNIKRLQPSEIITVTPTNLSSTKYYIPKYKHNNQVANNIQSIKNALISSIKRRLENYDSVGAALTGGFDSRVTWAIINYLNQKDQVTAFTHGLEESRDISIAKRIASKLDIYHKIKIFDRPFIKELPFIWEFFTRLTEGMMPVTEAISLPSWEFCSQYFKVLLDSHGGALYRRQFMKVAEKKINHSKDFAEQIFHYIKSPLLNFNLLNSEIQHSAISASMKALQEYFDLSSEIKDPGDKIDLFYIHVISGNRYSFAGNAQMNWIQLSHPYLSLDAFDSVQKISPYFRRNQSIYRTIINETYPAVKSFYLENMGLPAPYFGFTYLRYFPMIYEYFLQKSVLKINHSLYKKISLRKFVTNYDMFFRINEVQVREILLRHNHNFFGMINKSRLESLLKHIFEKTYPDSSQLSNLITLKLFYDIFHNMN
jgi:hypothetical protein